ncbi:MAG: D-aminoacyl-tRNA deacylase [Candidatus Kapaibacteriota bacterium]
MKVVVQKVKYSKLFIEDKLICSINNGLLVLVGLHLLDTKDLFSWFANKLINLRIFPDKEGKMNLSVKDINGEIMLVSNFTLYGNAQKGFRPSYSSAMLPEDAKLMYEDFVTFFQTNYPETKIVSGVFGEMMEIELLNDGPVTIIIEKGNNLSTDN